MFHILFQALFSYWPRLGSSKKAKTGAIPDPKTWGLYQIKILSTTGTNKRSLYC